MADTETSKRPEREIGGINHVIIWTISIRSMGFNWVTLWGNKPSELCQAIMSIKANLIADDVTFYWHNMSYDWTFIRKFIIRDIGKPKKQLAVKSHKPIYFQWDNGLIFRDSAILAQRSLEKWGNDLKVEHAKAVGKWDYEKIRNQDFKPDADEAEYIEHDTLCGVECLDALRLSLGKRYNQMPITATSIPRNELRKISNENKGRELFKRLLCSYDTYCKLEKVYHGGYTHGNRYMLNKIYNDVVCKDFTSSYLFALLAFKYPMEKFAYLGDVDYREIVKDQNNGYIMRFTMTNVRLKNPFEAMPVLQYSKADLIQGEVLDNGRIVSCDAVSIYINDIDLRLILDQYDADIKYASEVEGAKLAYLPRWFTDYVFKCFSDKCMLAPNKKKDPINYQIAKGKANAIYGMCCQHNIMISELEDFKTGLYAKEKPKKGESDEAMKRRLYEKFCNSMNSFLLYQWGCWCTSIAMHCLFELGKCTKVDMIRDKYPMHRWIYSDTDSIYSDAWNEDKVKAYNDKCKKMLQANGYGPVVVEGHEYWLGEAVTTPLEDEYSEYVAVGAKRYAGRCKQDNELHITVAGVPKSKGALCLDNDLKKFKKGLNFPGSITEKKTHFYVFAEDISIDEFGNEVGDSIDLELCDYLLDDAKIDHDAIYINGEEYSVENIEGDIYEEI